MKENPAPLILVADDDPSILSMVVVKLESMGYRTLEAPNGDEAWLQLRKHHPDLAVLDVMMPGLNGWEIVREMRRDEQLRDIGVVMLTAIGHRMNEMTSPLYGADAYLDKPFRFSVLEMTIRDVLRQRGVLRQHAETPDSDDT